MKLLKNVAVDNVIFGYLEKELKVLLQRPSGMSKWTLTGGYIKKTESINEAAARVAQIRTGLKNLFLQQFRSFGTPQRVKDPELTPENYSTRLGIELSVAHWVFDYYVSAGFYTLTEFSLVQIEKGPYDEDIRWWPLKNCQHLCLTTKKSSQKRLKPCRYTSTTTQLGMSYCRKNLPCQKFTVFMKQF